jgi:CysZ protein
MFRQIIQAVNAYGTAFNIIINHKLWLYFLYPVVLFVLLLIGGTALIDQFTDFLQEYVVNLFDLPKEDSAEISATSKVLSFIINIGLKIIFFLLYATILKYIILILLSPVLAILSERTDEIITGKKYKFNLIQLIKDAFRGSLIAIRNMFLQLALILCCFGLMTIPLIGWLTPLFLVIINYYFYGFGMIDYTNERYRLSVSESFSFIRRNKGLAIGNGFVFAVLFAIPFAGIVIAPIIAVIAATIVSVEAHKTNKDVLYAKD